MPIRITSKKEGFRRCGVAHSQKPRTYPDDRFSKEELGRLEAEPMLIVERIPEEPEDGDAGEPEKPDKPKKPDKGKVSGSKAQSVKK